jgi:hypothetical protein
MDASSLRLVTNRKGTSSPTVAKSIEWELRQAIRGEVRFDNGSRALYSTDSSNYRQTPIGIVLPQDREDVVKTIAICRAFGLPITGRAEERVSPDNAAISPSSSIFLNTCTG